MAGVAAFPVKPLTNEMAGVRGFEPRMTESESVALPLGDTPTGTS